MPMAMT